MVRLLKVSYKFDYSEEKDLVLIETRNIGFQDIINSISKGGLLDNLDHPSQKKHKGQKLFVVKIGRYIYVVPYIIDREKKIIFLKTLYPSRKMTSKYLRR